MNVSNEYFQERKLRKVYIFLCARSSSLYIFLDYTYRQFVFVDVFFPVTLDDMRLLASATHTSVSFSLSYVFERVLVFSISRLFFDRRTNILRDSLMDIVALNRPIFSNLYPGISVTLILGSDEFEKSGVPS